MEDIRDLVKQIRKAKSRVRWTSKTIKAETRKLRSEWTRDMSYDLSQYSGIDSSIEEELINTLLKELGNDRNSI
jgi:uncharacterized protein YukE